jgi:NAD+ synthase
MGKKRSASVANFPSIDLPRTSNLIQKFIKVRVSEAGANGIVIGLSGGIDSSVTVTLATKALGSEKIFPIFLQNENSRTSDISDIEKLCKTLKLKLVRYDIQPVINTFSEIIGENESPSDLEWMNLKPRLL